MRTRERLSERDAARGEFVRTPCDCFAHVPLSALSLFLLFSCRGYAVSVVCKLLNSSSSSYDLRREWELHYFPTLIDTAARTQVAAAFGPNPYAINLAFSGMPAGHRPDTIVIKYLPVSWVD